MKEIGWVRFNPDGNMRKYFRTPEKRKEKKKIRDWCSIKQLI